MHDAQTEYATHLGQTWGNGLMINVPRQLQRQVVDYVLRGSYPERLVAALFKNDLLTFLELADAETADHYRQLHVFLTRYVPRECLGPGYTEWMRRGGLLGRPD